MAVYYGPGQNQVPLKQWEQVEQRGALADRGARSHLSQHPLLLPHRPCGKTQDSESAELCSITSLALGWSPAPRSKHITTSVLEFPMKRKWYMPDQLRARLRDSHAYRQKAKDLCRHLLLFLPTAARVWQGQSCWNHEAHVPHVDLPLSSN